MLRSLTFKFCPLLALTVLGLSCGKKINDTSGTFAIHTDPPAPPSLLVLKLEGTGKTVYAPPMNGTLHLPTSLKIKQGSGIGKTITITYNSEVDDEEEFNIRCTYKSGNDSEIPLHSCINQYGMQFNDTSHPFRVDFDKYIVLKTTVGMDAGLRVEANYNVDWQ